jgi:hypothetical protein
LITSLTVSDPGQRRRSTASKISTLSLELVGAPGQGGRLRRGVGDLEPFVTALAR